MILAERGLSGSRLDLVDCAYKVDDIEFAVGILGETDNIQSGLGQGLGFDAGPAVPGYREQPAGYEIPEQVPAHQVGYRCTPVDVATGDR